MQIEILKQEIQKPNYNKMLIDDKMHQIFYKNWNFIMNTQFGDVT